MKLISEKTYSDIFFMGSLWNLAIGLGSLTTLKLSMRLLYGAKAVTENIVATLPLRFFYAAVAIFGWGYYMVSRDPKKNRGIVWMAIVAKLTIFVTFIYYYLKRKIKIIPFLLGLGDFIFSILFSLFLFETRNDADK
ncbi:MAG: hypothetical protein U9P49_05615 [Thermodesulfobacteriota bacterium]|nr:hypothetical protein [Thermodesulfobacteriota bacterium]